MVNEVAEVVIIIPAYNEGKTIFEVITKTQKFAQNIIVVDDGSQDNTAMEAAKAGAVVLRHKVNLGKGAALKTGCDYAVQQGAQNIITMDADGQHDPKEIPLFIAALEEHDIAFGSRKTPKSMPGVFKFGNKAITKTLQLLYGVTVEDSQCGYRSFRSHAYQNIRWEATDYYVETEMAIRTGKKKMKYITVPIETIYADKYKGTTVLDGVTIVAKMMGWKLWR
ncbi:MAG: glycosyltransferase family 2 protein [Nanoarchaeota archaeon]|nr:glycosyltransferase family 2 protein [Nanoarchaeota archaeon]